MVERYRSFLPEEAFEEVEPQYGPNLYVLPDPGKIVRIHPDLPDPRVPTADEDDFFEDTGDSYFVENPDETTPTFSPEPDSTPQEIESSTSIGWMEAGHKRLAELRKDPEWSAKNRKIHQENGRRVFQELWKNEEWRNDKIEQTRDVCRNRVWSEDSRIKARSAGAISLETRQTEEARRKMSLLKGGIREKILPYAARGANLDEITRITNLKRGQAYDSIKKIYADPKNDITASTKTRNDITPQYLDSEGQIVNTGMVRRFQELELFNSDPTVWSELKALYDENSRDWPISVAEQIRLEIFYEAMQSMVNGEQNIMHSYNSVGTEIYPEFQDQGFNAEEQFIFNTVMLLSDQNKPDSDFIADDVRNLEVTEAVSGGNIVQSHHSNESSNEHISRFKMKLRKQEQTDDKPLDSFEGLSRRIQEAEGGRLLTREEETELAKLIDAGKLAKSMLDEIDDIPDNERLRLNTVIQKGMQARDLFALSNQRLVTDIAITAQQRGRKSSLSDLRQDGNEGLLIAIDKFDYRKGFKFSTYGTYWIRQKINRGVMKNGDTIRLSDGMNAQLHEMIQAGEVLKQEYGREPTSSEIADFLGLSESQLQSARAALELSTISFDSDTVSPNSSQQLSEIVADNNEQNVERTAIDSALVSNLLEYLNHPSITPYQREVITLRYLDDKPRSFREVADIFGVSHQAIGYIEKKVFKKLKQLSGFDKIENDSTIRSDHTQELENIPTHHQKAAIGKEEILMYIDNPALTKGQRDVLRLRYLETEEPRTFREVAKILGISQQAASQNNQRALNTVREFVSDANGQGNHGIDQFATTAILQMLPPSLNHIQRGHHYRIIMSRLHEYVASYEGFAALTDTVRDDLITRFVNYEVRPLMHDEAGPKNRHLSILPPGHALLNIGVESPIAAFESRK